MDITALALALIILLGIVLTRVLTKIRVPSFIGVIVLGIILGPACLGIIDTSLLNISSTVGTAALVIILLRAGLGLSRESLRKVGRPAVEMSFLPSIFEGLTVMVAGALIFNISFIESGMMGFVLAAVSPAVLVPPLLGFIERRKGTKKGIPTLLMAGSSADDVVAITLFSVFLSMYSGTHTNILGSILGIPVSLLLGLLLGVVTGFILLYIFRKFDLSSVEKMLITFSVGILMNSLAEILEGTIPVSGLLGVMVIGFLLLDRAPKMSYDLSNTFTKVWYLAEIVLFALIGAQLDIGLAWKVLPLGILVICIGLCGRFAGVFTALLGTPLNKQEKVFCMAAYIPKASVQAAIGAVPLAAGVASGDLILAISVISILFTAPIGAILLNVLGEKFLSDDSEVVHEPKTIPTVH